MYNHYAHVEYTLAGSKETYTTWVKGIAGDPERFKDLVRTVYRANNRDKVKFLTEPQRGVIPEMLRDGSK